MFKSLNRKSPIGTLHNRIGISFCLLIIGMFSSVFAIDLSQAFSQANDQSVGMDSLFSGKAAISNLYSKALKVVKDKEITSTTFSFDELKKYFGTCAPIENGDIINVLYNSNTSFRNTFDQILPSGTKSPTRSEIDKSYQKFFSFRNIFKPTSSDIQSLNTEINRLYYDIYSTTYTMSALNKSNFGSDLLWNGTLDDSDFDLLYDINQVGKVFFESFDDSPQILFYRLPSLQSRSSLHSNTSSFPLSGSSQAGSVGSSLSAAPGSSSGNPISLADGSSSPDTSSLSPDISITADKEVQNFIATTNINPSSSSSPAALPLVFGNQCLTSDVPVPVDEEILMTPEVYISGINNFIQNANLDNVISNNLITQFTLDVPLSGGSTSDSGYADKIARIYAQKALGDAALGTCEYACNALPLDKQVQCELSCAKSCIQTCSDTHKSTLSSCGSTYIANKLQCQQLSLVQKTACLVSALAQNKTCTSQSTTDQLLCVSDCTCFLVAGPNGKGREKMEEMFRIKFCKVPVQTRKLSPGKTVFSIQAIFQEISDVLEGLRDSGKMVKFSKTKEFLDGNIKIKFADNFAFKLQVGFKPVFEQIPTPIKIHEQTQANLDLNVAVLDMNAGAPEADNYNKYVVVSDIIGNDATSQPANTVSEINQNIENLTIAAEKTEDTKISPQAIDAVLSSYSQNTNTLFVQNMIEFLKDNQLFLNNLSEALLDMNKMSIELKNKIEESN